MTRSRRRFTTGFLASLAVQFAIWLLYWLFGIDSSGGETTFQKVVHWFYWPVLALIEAFQYGVGWRTWFSLGFLLVFGPLIGAVIYSAVFAFAVHIFRRNDSGERLAA
jgi:hypothetical protein